MTVDRNLDGFVDMYPDETTTQLARVHTVGADFGRAWAKALERINSPGKIGNGGMGQSFMAGYAADKETLVTAAGSVRGVYQALANNGYQGVQLYQGAAIESTKLFPPE
ncbi:hypothetical protein AB0M47_03270 [Hamadaea sp. NPDC051192]|uniref:hypothetical protein n=1 Tax=Hamadaea sp. NPDC051192 TaxID=3154940 RepID=UPI0034291FC1